MSIIKRKRKKQSTPFNFKPFTIKQLKALTWWHETSPYYNCNGIICDGAIRAGKTLVLSLSYVQWAMDNFDCQNFIMAGKTVASFKRNVYDTLKQMIIGLGYDLEERISENMFIVRFKGHENYFYIFGGRDESSQSLVQGITAAGAFFDEVALMPESFVSQATARCSVENSKWWFNCNPDSPYHWFKLNWVDKCVMKGMYHLHFVMQDNPSLSQKIIERYESMYTGVFYDRFIKGLWCVAEGTVYQLPKEAIIKNKPIDVVIRRHTVSVDYGNSNPTVFLDLGMGSDGILYILNEYYHDGRNSLTKRSPRGYVKEMKKFLVRCNKPDSEAPIRYDYIVVDPSAEGFILQLYEEEVHNIRKANNTVLKGIELVSSLIACGRLKVLSHCTNTIMEFNNYVWDEKAQERGEDKPVKQHDHCMDALRYGVMCHRSELQELVKNEGRLIS